MNKSIIVILIVTSFIIYTKADSALSGCKQAEESECTDDTSCKNALDAAEKCMNSKCGQDIDYGYFQCASTCIADQKNEKLVTKWNKIILCTQSIPILRFSFLILAAFLYIY